MSKLQKTRPTTDAEWCYRSAGMVGQADEDQRTVDLVLATDAPVRTYDFERLSPVDEVLHMGGADLPKQIPLLDSHNRETTRAVIGSIRDLRVEGSQLLGRAYFASNPEAVSVFNNYRDGHLTDFSIGARRLEREYNGGTLHVKRFRPIEGSAVVVGADPNAKALSVSQRAYIEPDVMAEESEAKMIETLRSEFNVPDDIPADDVVGWIKRNVTAVETVESVTPEEDADMAERHETETVDVDAVKRAERERVAKIRDICRRQSVAEDEIQRFIDSDLCERDVAWELLNLEQQKQAGKESVGPGPDERVEFGDSEQDKFFRAAGDALTLRALQGAGKQPTRVLEAAKASHNQEAIQRSEALVATASRPAPGIETLRYMSMADIARECLIRTGQRVDGLPKQEIVKRAMVMRAADGYHTTGSFSNLLLDAANKTLLAAYDEAPASATRWARQAASVPDFKTLYRIRFGETPNPEEVPELQDYPEGSVSDSKESYRVAKHGQLFSISMEAVINDDLDAISRMPAMQGNAMRRKLNKDIYQILIDNPNLSDGIALFHASSHGENLDATALSETALDVGFKVMMTQTGLNSDAILNIMPRFLIVPAALSATAYRLVGGGIVPESVSNVPLYGASGPRPIEVIVDAQLDVDSATAWYLAADSNVVDTIEYTFLQGEESPVLDREEGFVNDSLRYKIRQSYGVKAIDYRGLYQGNA